MKSPAMSRAKQTRSGPALTARLRILETTDLHMQLLGYDYFADYPTPDLGLIPLAGLIEAHRSDPTVSTLLFDNGDFLQGNPLADYVVTQAEQVRPNPVIAAFNALSYDAVTLGNHEFNYGIDVLTRALGDARFPVICANVSHFNGAPYVPPYVIIDKPVICDDGQMRILRVGVIGFVTPQILNWDKALLAGKIATTDIVEAAAKFTPQMRAEGAEIIVALCHSGIGAVDWTHNMENAAVPLAALPEIDVVLMGHTHDQFPDPRGHAQFPIDAVTGTLHGKPAVLAGFYGSHLGVMTLDLTWTGEVWTITGAQSRLERPDPARRTALQAQITALVEPAHQATLAYIRQPIAQSAVAIDSYFATTAPDLTLEVLADAQMAHLRQLGAGTDWDGLPVLSAVAPYRVGGHGGPNHFIAIPAGPLTLRDAAAIYPFTNALYLVRRTGAQIRAWLEKSSRYFNTLAQGEQQQPLVNPDVPPYNFDVIFGLTYTFDVSRADTRVTGLMFQGKPVRDDENFVVATNSYRANGGGDFFAAMPDDIAYVSTISTRDILIETLRDTGHLNPVPRKVWGFGPMAQTAAQFTSNASAIPPNGSRIQASGKTRDGFGIFTLTL